MQQSLKKSEVLIKETSDFVNSLRIVMFGFFIAEGEYLQKQEGDGSAQQGCYDIGNDMMHLENIKAYKGNDILNYKVGDIGNKEFSVP